MAISSLSGSEYVGVKVFLYKYTPFFDYIDGETQAAQLSQTTGSASPSSDAVNVFTSMTANISSFLTATQNVINSPDVNAIVGYQNGVVGINGDAIATLINQYAPIINSLNNGGYIFTTASLLNSQSISTSLNNLNGGTIVPQSTDPSTITGLVINSLSNSTAKPTVGLSSYFVIPQQTTVITSPDGFVTPTSGLWYPFLQQLFNSDAPPTVVQTYLVPIFQAWLIHAQTLNAQLKFIQTYSTTLSGAGTTQSSSNQVQVEQQFQITKYQIQLNANQFFSKFDITQFVKGYSFNQGLYGNDYSWSLNLQDVIIPFSQLNPSSTVPTIRKTAKYYDPDGNLIVEAKGPPCRSSAGEEFIANDLVYLMAQYESEDTYQTTFDADVETITSAFLSRGTIQVPYQSTFQLQSQTGLTFASSPPPLNLTSGIRLSDLLQKYNFISVFTYKSSVSFENAKQAAFPNGVPISEGVTVPFDESNEVHLMLAGFKNEFNGYIVNKSKTQTQGQVDTVTVEGNGILRLFSDTMTLFDASQITGGFYGAAVLNLVTPNISTSSDPNVTPQGYFNVYENKFQGQNPVQILASLLNLIYGVNFIQQNVQTTVNGAALLSELQGFYDFYRIESQQGTPILPALTPLNGQTQQPTYSNLFAIGPFLLACVMALRNFNFNLTNGFAGSSTSSQTGIRFDQIGPGQNSNPDNKFFQISPPALIGSQFSEQFGGPMAQIFYETSDFIPFFAMYKTSFENYVTKFKTPHDIMDDVCKNSFLEFFERPNGRVILRTPQYNQISRFLLNGSVDPVGNLLQSSSFNVISANYGEDSTQLKTQRRGSYNFHFNPSGNVPFLIPAYGNGKLMAQYGFREGITEPNPVLAPNVFNTQPSQGVNQSQSTLNISALISKYVRFILEYENAELRTGSLSLDGDPNLEVGKMFFDSKNNKIGYIIGVSKSLTIGQTYTANIQLKFVRDAMLSVNGNSVFAEFRLLPTLEELVTSTGEFQLGKSATPIIEFTSVPGPTANTQTLQSINQQLIQGLGTGPYIGGLGTSSI
jgi:hypothetical protein